MFKYEACHESPDMSGISCELLSRLNEESAAHALDRSALIKRCLALTGHILHPESKKLINSKVFSAWTHLPFCKSECLMNRPTIPM